MVAQCFIFFVAGFDTVATTMCFAAHELAVNPTIQQRLYDEISEANRNGDPMTYDRLQKCKYLDMVLSETMRKWPAGGIIDRICNQDTELDMGAGMEPIKLCAGDPIVIPIYAIHRDAQFYPEPDRFDPERFTEENVKDRPATVYMPFGIGPRMCIASRFALTECKALLYNLVLEFRLEKCERTQDPLRLGVGLSSAPEKGFWLKFTRRDNATK